MDLLPAPTPTPQLLQSAATLLLDEQATGQPLYWRGLRGFRLNGVPNRSIRLLASDEELVVEADGTRQHSAILSDDHVVVFEAGQAFVFEKTRSHAPSIAEGNENVIAPMPGRIVALPIRSGDTVAQGQPLITLEAMKMEHQIKAPFEAVIEAVNVKEAQQVKEGDLLIKLKKTS